MRRNTINQLKEYNKEIYRQGKEQKEKEKRMGGKIKIKWKAKEKYLNEDEMGDNRRIYIHFLFNFTMEFFLFEAILLGAYFYNPRGKYKKKSPIENLVVTDQIS